MPSLFRPPRNNCEKRELRLAWPALFNRRNSDRNRSAFRSLSYRAAFDKLCRGEYLAQVFRACGHMFGPAHDTAVD